MRGTVGSAMLSSARPQVEVTCSRPQTCILRSVMRNGTSSGPRELMCKVASNHVASGPGSSEKDSKLQPGRAWHTVVSNWNES